jgi:hypothetical protein
MSSNSPGPRLSSRRRKATVTIDYRRSVLI